MKIKTPADRKLLEIIKPAKSAVKITENEYKALLAIVKSEYQDGGDPVDHAVWTRYVNPFPNKRTQSGVYSSLVKKGCIEISEYEPGQGTVSITQDGADALAFYVWENDSKSTAR